MCVRSHTSLYFRYLGLLVTLFIASTSSSSGFFAFVDLFIQIFIEHLLYARYCHGHSLDYVREKSQINILALKDSAGVAMIVDIRH